jgi:hypothetical protein
MFPFHFKDVLCAGALLTHPFEVALFMVMIGLSLLAGSGENVQLQRCIAPTAPTPRSKGINDGFF